MATTLLGVDRVREWSEESGESKLSNFDSSGNAGDLGPDDVLVSTHVDEIMSRWKNVFIHLLRDIPSEKIGQNIHPPESSFFVVNYQHWTGTSAFRPFLAPLDHWGGLGGPG